MSRLLTLRRPGSTGGDLDERLRGLAAAVDAGAGRLPAAELATATAVVDRAAQRLGLGVGAAVVALAGATGSGKSSLFNALVGTDLSAVGVRRPTTATAIACWWGETSADPLLDWLAVPRRHAAGVDPALDGLVLLDLPDHDSTERSHRAEVDRLVAVVDLLVWVLDPQKYADAAVHERYLVPLAGHSDVMLVLLNQADRLPPTARESCLVDLRRLLAAEGLAGVPVLATSARTGEGVPELRRLLTDRVASRRAAAERLAADVVAVTAALARYCGGRAAGVPAGASADVAAALAAAAGVDTVVAAVDRSHRSRAALATGWPPLRWLRRLRPDPLRRLHLGGAPVEGSRTSLPPASAAARAGVRTAVRALGATAGAGLPDPWPELVSTAARRDEAALPDRLDAAVAGADLGPDRRPRWWALTGAAQRLLATVALVGGLWLLVLFGWSYLQLGDPPVPHVGRLPVPTLLLVPGVLAGLLLALLSRRLAGWGARRRARAARRRLEDRVDRVAAEAVLEPVEEELAAYERWCAALRRARG